MNSTPIAFDAGRPRLSRPIRWLTRVVEPIASPLAGTRWFPLWAILGHTGRTSGKAYSTPIVALRTGEGFIIPLPFGDAALRAGPRGQSNWSMPATAPFGNSLQKAQIASSSSTSSRTRPRRTLQAHR